MLAVFVNSLWQVFFQCHQSSAEESVLFQSIMDRMLCTSLNLLRAYSSHVEDLQFFG